MAKAKITQAYLFLHLTVEVDGEEVEVSSSVLLESPAQELAKRTLRSNIVGGLLREALTEAMKDG